MNKKIGYFKLFLLNFLSLLSNIVVLFDEVFQKPLTLKSFIINEPILIEKMHILIFCNFVCLNYDVILICDVIK